MGGSLASLLDGVCMSNLVRKGRRTFIKNADLEKIIRSSSPRWYELRRIVENARTKKAFERPTYTMSGMTYTFYRACFRNEYFVVQVLITGDRVDENEYSVEELEKMIPRPSTPSTTSRRK